MTSPPDQNRAERNYPDPLHGLIRTPDEPSAPAASRASITHQDQDGLSPAGGAAASSPDSPQCGCTGTHFHPPDLNKLGLAPRGSLPRDKYSRQVAQENGREKLMTRCKEVTAMMGPDLTDPKNRTRKMSSQKSSTLVTKYSGPSTFLPTVTGSSPHSSSLLTPGTSGFPPLSSDESVRHRKHHKKSGKRARKSSSNSKRRRASPKGLANTGNSLPKLAISNSAGGVSYPHTDSKVFKVDRLQPLHTTTTGASAHRTIRGDKKSPHKRRKSSKTST
ncbi:uncharacterized protein LOC144868703 isoform X1 [Branchiostoma floridae x Branchiostoma japonicum]